MSKEAILGDVVCLFAVSALSLGAFSAAVRKEAKRQVDTTCQMCGILESDSIKIALEGNLQRQHGPLQAHHIIPESTCLRLSMRESGQTLKNLIIVCPTCHKEMDRRSHIIFGNNHQGFIDVSMEALRQTREFLQNRVINDQLSAALPLLIKLEGQHAVFRL